MNMRTKTLLFSILLLLLVAPPAMAQQAVVNARVDSSVIYIGDQTQLRFELTQLPDQHVQQPLFSDTIIDGVDIVAISPSDTTAADQGRIRITKSYTITAFDDSLYYLPPAPFVVGNETIWSKALSLKVVQPFVIDTTQSTIADIKGVYKPPIYWWGIFRVVLIVLGAILLLILLAFLYWRYLYKPKGIDGLVLAPPKRPPFEIAIAELDKIKNEKMWQQANRQKEYYTALTDVVRLYIDGTMDLGSMEMTSAEIIHHIAPCLSDNKGAIDTLKELLTLADLVKFAKFTATPEQNEASLRHAYKFVNDTKPMEVTQDDIS